MTFDLRQLKATATLLEMIAGLPARKSSFRRHAGDGSLTVLPCMTTLPTLTNDEVGRQDTDRAGGAQTRCPWIACFIKHNTDVFARNGAFNGGHPGMTTSLDLRVSRYDRAPRDQVIPCDTLSGSSLARRTVLSGREPVSRARQRALTLIELLFAIAILGVVSSLAYGGYQQYLQSIRIVQAKTDIRTMELELERYHVKNNRFPETLAEAGLGGMRDPWNRPYQYLNIQTTTNRGNVRKDRKLVPINSDYDLYSVGKDGLSKPPLTAKDSLDDVIRASNGAFIGVAADY